MSSNVIPSVLPRNTYHARKNPKAQIHWWCHIDGSLFALESKALEDWVAFNVVMSSGEAPSHMWEGLSCGGHGDRSRSMFHPVHNAWHVSLHPSKSSGCWALYCPKPLQSWRGMFWPSQNLSQEQTMQAPVIPPMVQPMNAVDPNQALWEERTNIIPNILCVTGFTHADIDELPA